MAQAEEPVGPGEVVWKAGLQGKPYLQLEEEALPSALEQNIPSVLSDRLAGLGTESGSQREGLLPWPSKCHIPLSCLPCPGAPGSLLLREGSGRSTSMHLPVCGGGPQGHRDAAPVVLKPLDVV